MHKRYTDNGTIFTKEENGKREWAIQVNHILAGPGAAFKTVVHVNWINSKAPLGFAETNENPEMYGWTLTTPAELALFADQGTIKYIEHIQGAIRLGYKGWHQTSQATLDELAWRLSQ